MKNKKMMGVVFVFLLSMMVPTYFVWANDDDNEYEYEEHDRDDDSRYHEEDDEHEYEYEYQNEDNNDVNWQPAPVETVPAATWDVWSRTLDTEKGTLPFADSKTVKIENQDGKQMKSNVISNQGEIMIPTEKTAELIGATVKYYKTTKIAEMQLDGNELIVKSGSNAVYENDTKTPMSVEAMMYQDDLYIPISVLTNGLGLTVTWDETKQTFLIQQ